MESLVTLTIDGQPVSVPPGTTVLEAARLLGIEIPTLCHYAKLSRLGACRLCLVEVERMKALQTACTTVVRPEMVVYTDKPEILATRRAMLEFLLTNHPLDCPVCDAGGECELQDLTFAHGPAVSRFIEEKRHKGKALLFGPGIIMDQERCVLCRRCVRFLEEWADEPYINYVDRGARTYVSTFPGQELVGKFVGNVVELCPVGALTDRSYRFQARPWDLASTPSICSLCGVGCNVTLDVKSDTLRRVRARHNPSVNDEWLCDKGRFAHGFVHSPDRLVSPLIRRNGELRPAGWEEALKLVAERLSSVVQEHGPDAVGGLGSATATNEANYLFQRFIRGVVGTNNLDHVGRMPEQASPLDLARLPEADLVVLCGVELAEEAPLVELFLRNRALAQGDVRFVGMGPKSPALLKYGGVWLSCAPQDLVAVINGLTILLLKGDRVKRVANVSDLASWVEPFSPEEVERQTGAPVAALRGAADALAKSQRPLFIYGPSVAGQAGVWEGLNNVSLLLAAPPPAFISPYCNTRGALDMGITPAWLPGRQPVGDERVRDRLGKAWKSKLPAQPGLDLAGMRSALTEGRLKAICIMRSDPAAEAAGWSAALQAGAFVVVQTLFLTETAKLADVVLPTTSFAEMEGTFTNLAGRVQRVHQAVPLPAGVRSDEEIIRALAAAMKAGFAYEGSEGVMRELARLAPLYGGVSDKALEEKGLLLAHEGAARRVSRAEYNPRPTTDAYPYTLVVGRILYDGDEALRRSRTLDQMTPEPYVEIHPRDAARLNVTTGVTVKVISRVGELTVAARVTEGVCEGCVFLPLRVRDALAASILDDGPVTRVAVRRS